MAKFPVAGTAPTDAPTIKQDAAFVPDFVTFVGVPLAQAAVTGVGLALLASLVLAAAIVLLGLHLTARAWLLAGLGALAIAVFVTVDEFPARRQEVLDGWYKRELRDGRDYTGDNVIGAPGAHPVMTTVNGGSQLTDVMVIDGERALFQAFIRTAETANTVRALAAAGWRDERLCEKYRMWLTDIVRMPDGGMAAERYGKGQWRLRYPAADILPVVDRMEWIVDAAQNNPQPRHN